MCLRKTLINRRFLNVKVTHCSLLPLADKVPKGRGQIGKPVPGAPGADFEPPSAGPKGGGQDARSNRAGGEGQARRRTPTPTLPPMVGEGAFIFGGWRSAMGVSAGPLFFVMAGRRSAKEMVFFHQNVL